MLLTVKFILMPQVHRRQSGNGTHKRGFDTKIHLAVDEVGMPLGVVVTAGTVSDCTKAVELLGGLKANALFTDRGYDTNEIIGYAENRGVQDELNKKKRVDFNSFEREVFASVCQLGRELIREVLEQYDKELSMGRVASGTAVPPIPIAVFACKNYLPAFA